jgi:hypothetical protein
VAGLALVVRVLSARQAILALVAATIVARIVVGMRERTIHQRYHSKYIGVSEYVTIDRLEYIAAALQSFAQER